MVDGEQLPAMTRNSTGSTRNAAVAVDSHRREYDRLAQVPFHFHIGSQVSRIATIKEAMRESSQMYAELVRLGAPMGYIDVGGGLGVDYSGSQGGGGHMSTNYNMQNYANDIVAALKDTCIRTGIQPPVIVSESGRAIVSSSAALVFEVIETEPRGARGSSSVVVGTDADQTFMETEHIERGSEAPIEELRMMAPGAFLLHNFREVLKTVMWVCNQCLWSR